MSPASQPSPAELAALAEESRLSAARLRILSEASQLFVEASLDLPSLLEAVARKIADELGDMLIVWMLSPDGASFDPVASRHRDPKGSELLDLLLCAGAQDAGEGINGRVLATRQTVFLPRMTLAQVVAESPPEHKPHAGRLGTHSLIVTPLAGRGRAFGTLAAARVGASPPYTEADRDLLEDLARSAGLAIENALLYEREREARRAAELSRERLTLLADASTILGSSLDVEATVESLARLVLPGFADLCMVDLVDASGVLCPVALAHVDPVKERRLARGRLDDGPRGLRVPPLVEERRPLLNPHLLTPKDAALEDHELFWALRQIGARWSILVPLCARGRLVGVLSFGRESEEAAYTEEDLTWADELGRRVAVVIDNARLYQHAQQAVRVRDDFLGIAGHELKTPLTALQLSLQGLARLPPGSGDMEDVSARRLRSCLRQVDRLGRLIHELLDVSRITAGRMSLQPERVDLAALTREVLARMAEELARAGCEVTLRVDEGVVGRWDRERLDQVISNLVSNAAKYGKGKPIAVTLRAEQGAARLAVRDEGIGIAPEDQARIFERFERAVSERNYGGLGLGLWIVRQIVEAHGGAVRVESAVDEGSTFVVDLPLASESS